MHACIDGTLICYRGAACRGKVRLAGLLSGICAAQEECSNLGPRQTDAGEEERQVVLKLLTWSKRSFAGWSRHACSCCAASAKPHR